MRIDCISADIRVVKADMVVVSLFEGAKRLAVEFTTMSKGFNMAGWRVGFCAGNAEMIRALSTIKGYYDYGMFRPIQIAAIVALRHTDAAVEALTHLLTTDVWTSMGFEAENKKRKKDFAGWQVNAAMMKAARKDALFMHCLPAHRGEEVTSTGGLTAGHQIAVAHNSNG